MPSKSNLLSNSASSENDSSQENHSGDSSSNETPDNTQRESRGNFALALAALGLAVIGQIYFSFVQDDLQTGVIFFITAIIFFVILFRRSETRPPIEASVISIARLVRDRIINEPVKVTLVTLSFALAYTTVRILRFKPSNESHWDVLILWMISFLVYATAFIRLPRLNIQTWLRTNRQDVITVAILTVIAGVLRFIALGSVPNIISGDEGQIGTLAVQFLNGDAKNMMGTVYGHSNLYLLIMAGFMKLFGVNTTTLRLASALGGVLSVPVLYLFARRLFNPRVALVAASLVTVSHFHLHFSRIIVATSIQDALFATLTFYFFITGLEKRSVARFVLSGLIIGFELYIYMGARLVILLIPIYVIALLITNRKMVEENLGNLLAYAGALLVISAPMAFWAIEHTNEFMARANQLGIIQTGWLANEAMNTGQSQFHILLDQMRQAFLTINYFPAQGFYYTELPMLDFITGAFFILGLAYSLYHVSKPLHLLLNGWFWSGVLVGGALVVLPAKGAYRIMIVFPVVCLFIAIAWDRLMEYGGRSFPNNQITRTVPTVLFIALFSFLNLKAYFIDYAPSCNYEGINTRLASQIGSYMGELGPEYEVYLAAAPRQIYGIYRSIDFLSGNIPINNISDPISGPPTFIDVASKAVFFFTPERENELTYVQSYLPGGKIDRVFDCQDLLMVVYLIPGE
jgi:hypothetical protein